MSASLISHVGRRGPVKLSDVAVMASAAFIGVVVTIPSVYTVPLALYAAYALVLCMIPLRLVPAALLVVWVLIPMKYLPVPDIMARTLGPNIVGVGVLSVRAGIRLAFPGPKGEATHKRPSLRIPPTLLALTAWFCICLAGTGFQGRSLAWTASMVVLTVLLALCIQAVPEAVKPLATTWCVLAALVGAVAVVETFILKQNPLYGAFYALPTGDVRPLTQVWSVYRATTTLGHPLVNSLFMAMSLPMLCQAILKRHAREKAIVLSCFVVGGLIAAGSRGAVGAAAVGGMATFVVHGFVSQRGRSVWLARIVTASLALLTVLLLANVPYLTERSGSGEGRASTEYRGDALRAAPHLVLASPLFGVGPGAAEKVRNLENSWLEWAVALGLPGFVILAWVLADAGIRALRARDEALVGTLTVLVIGAAGFNFLEGHHAGHLTLGLVLGWAYAAPRGHFLHSTGASDVPEYGQRLS